MLDAPSRAIAHPDEALQFEGRHVVLGLGQKVHGLEPFGQGQFAGVEDRPCSEGNLSMAAVALEGLNLAMPDDAVAARTTDGVGPTQVVWFACNSFMHGVYFDLRVAILPSKWS